MPELRYLLLANDVLGDWESGGATVYLTRAIQKENIRNPIPDSLCYC